MHILDVLALRNRPGSGVYLSITRRCPLTCAHCSTRSTMESEEHPERILLDFVDTFTPESHPEVIGMTGGEPLLRPALVLRLAQRAHAAGSKVALVSGLFFARGGAIPPAIDAAIAEVDQFSISLDRFHEATIPREGVFQVVHTLVNRGQQCSFLLVGDGPQDPYLVELTARIRREFADRVPMLVSYVAAIGRGKALLKSQTEQLATAMPEGEPSLQPCNTVTWPVVRYDGTIVACCNQDAIDGEVPAHLAVGHATTDTWEAVHQRYLTRPALRALRTFGPAYVASLVSGRACSGMCDTCRALPYDGAAKTSLDALFARPSTRWIEAEVAGMMAADLTHHTRREHLPLAQLGQP